MFTWVSNDLPIALQYLNPVASFVRYAKHPMTNDLMLKIHSSPLDDEVLTATSVTPNVPAQYSNKLNYPSISVGHKYNITSSMSVAHQKVQIKYDVSVTN